MASRTPPRYYDHLAGRLREFAAARIVTSLARRPQTAYVVLRGRVPNLLRSVDEGLRATSATEDNGDQTPSPALRSPALFKRQITVPWIAPLKSAKPVVRGGNGFNLNEDQVAPVIGKTMPDTVAEMD
jgi:hypothetical protein